MLGNFSLPTTVEELEALVASDLTGGEFSVLLFHYPDEVVPFLYHLVRSGAPEPTVVFWADVAVNKPNSSDTLAWAFLTENAVAAIFRPYYRDFKLLDLDKSKPLWENYNNED